MRWLSVVLSIFAVTLASASTVPQFASLPAGPVYRGRSARPVLSDPSAYSYRTRIIDSAKQPVNFAGHYHLATWGCGTSCAMGAVTDAITGRVTMLPFSICCYSGPMDEGFDSIIGKPTSRLIVFSGQRNEEGLNGTHFYEFDGREFRFIMSKAAPPDPSREPDPAPTPPVENSPLSASNIGADCKKLTDPKARLSCYDHTSTASSGDLKPNAPPLMGKVAVPRMASRLGYAAVRNSLLNKNWQPAPDKSDMTDPRGCDMDRPDVCKPNWTEVMDCAGTGQAPCLMRWQNGATIIKVHTLGDPALLNGIECVAGCR